MKILKSYTRELIVTLFIFFLLFLLISPAFILTIENFLLLSSFGLLLLFFWFFAVYFLYANKKVKRHGEVLLRVRFTEKFFKFFLLPSLFYIVVVSTIFFIKSTPLNLLIIITFSVILFVLLVHIRSSYEKIYYLSAMTKIIYDAVIIMLFFLSLFVITSFGYKGLNLILMSSMLAIILFFYKLIIEKQFCLNGLFLTLFSGIFIGVVSYLVIDYNIFMITAINTLAFYLTVSMWSIRLQGYTQWGDYFPPILYTLMALILIFSL